MRESADRSNARVLELRCLTPLACSSVLLQILCSSTHMSKAAAASSSSSSGAASSSAAAPAAASSSGSSSLDALEGFRLLCKTSSGAQCVMVLQLVLKHPQIFVFG